MLKQILLFIFTLCLSNAVFAQDYSIPTPSIATPEFELQTWWEKEKLDNPIFLNGPVKSVKKAEVIVDLLKQDTISQYYYEYQLNTEKQMTHYEGHFGYDDKSVVLFNAEKPVYPTNDTIIEQDNSKYYFKNGKLIHETVINPEIGIVIDSSSYLYKANKLTEIKNYKKDVSEMIEDINNSDNLTLAVPVNFSLNAIHSTKYNDKEHLKARRSIFIIDARTELVHTDYQYNSKDQLEYYKSTIKVYDVELNIKDYSFPIQNENTELKPINISETFGVFEYNDNGQIVSLNIREPNGNNKEHKIEYIEANKTRISTLINNKFNKTVEVIYDQHKNPTEVKTYEYENGKKAYQETIQLSIDYFE